MWWMASIHDGLMMLLTVGRNHTLRLVVFMIGGCIIYVISFTYFIVLNLYHGFEEDDVSLFLCIFF